MRPEQLMESFNDFYKLALEEAEEQSGTTIGQQAIMLNESQDSDIENIKDKYARYFADHRKTPRLTDEEEDAVRRFQGDDIAVDTAKNKVSMEDNEKQFWRNAIKSSTNLRAKEYAKGKLNRLEEAPEGERWVQRKLKAKDDYRYCGNCGRSWVTKASTCIDTWPTEEAAIEDGLANFKKSFKFGTHWTVEKLSDFLEEASDADNISSEVHAEARKASTPRAISTFDNILKTVM